MKLSRSLPRHTAVAFLTVVASLIVVEGASRAQSKTPSSAGAPRAEPPGKLRSVTFTTTGYSQTKTDLAGRPLTDTRVEHYTVGETGTKVRDPKKSSDSRPMIPQPAKVGPHPLGGTLYEGQPPKPPPPNSDFGHELEVARTFEHPTSGATKDADG
jgi:hypothetical protein